MENENKDADLDEWLKRMPVQSENPAFNPEEMIECARCARMNPPTRLKCLYCGAELKISAEQSRFIKPNLRKLENWEKGVNVIYIPTERGAADHLPVAEIARLLKIEIEFFQKFLTAAKKLPLACAESRAEAEIMQQRLKELSVETVVVSDEDLMNENQIKRIRGIEFWDESLVFVLFNGNEIVEVSTADLALIVAGAVFEKKVEATETRERKGESKILQTFETANDEFLIDIYVNNSFDAFRLYAKGFDFSSLESEKSILASENIYKLIEKIRRAAPHLAYIDDYLGLRHLLGQIWNIEEKTSTQGVKRHGVGNFNLASVTLVNNLQQFTKYSRLQRHLL